MHAGHLQEAGSFLIRGQKALPNDPEIYFHLGQYSMALNHHTEARLMLKQCLLISPTYRPASELLGKLPESA
jgi:tetratricopeptide (TPR) repeat protein